MTLNEVLKLIVQHTQKFPKRSGNSYSSLCPAHPDRNPSLSISEGANGKVLVKCFAGCPIDAICSALNISTSDLFPADTPIIGIQKDKRIDYHYYDAQGTLVCTKVKTIYRDGSKKYYLKYNDDGATIDPISGRTKILYNLRDVNQAICEQQPIFLVEGEKDAENLKELGLVATTAPITTEWIDEFTRTLKAADVIILYDYDKTGIHRRDLLCKKLYGQVKRLRVVDLPGLEYRNNHGLDVTDWILQGNGKNELLALVEKTMPYNPPGAPDDLRVASFNELLNLELPEREMLLEPFLPSQGLVMIVAKRGVGKTHVAIGIAYAVASGGSFFNWVAPNPKPVLYIDGEMPAVVMQERLKIAQAMSAFPINDEQYLRFITPDLQDRPMPDLATSIGRALIEQYIQEAELIIIDNISCLFRSGNENESECWQGAQEWALDLRRRGKSVLFVHHTGKNGKQRGTSKREDILDAIIMLEHPDDYQPEQGARFKVYFDKARHFTGQDAQSFHAQLIQQDERLIWEVTNAPEEIEIAKVAELTKQGKTIKEIGSLLTLTKAQVELRQKKAKEKGML